MVVVARVSGFAKDAEAKACAKVLCKRSSRVLSRRRFGPHRLDSVRAVKAGTGAGGRGSRQSGAGLLDAARDARPACTTNLGRVLLAGARWHAVSLATLPADAGGADSIRYNPNHVSNSSMEWRRGNSPTSDSKHAESGGGGGTGVEEGAETPATAQGPASSTYTEEGYWNEDGTVEDGTVEDATVDGTVDSGGVVEHPGDRHSEADDDALRLSTAAGGRPPLARKPHHSLLPAGKAAFSASAAPSVVHLATVESGVFVQASPREAMAGMNKPDAGPGSGGGTATLPADMTTLGDDSLLGVHRIEDAANGAASEMGSTAPMLRGPSVSESVPTSPVPKSASGKTANPLAASAPVDPSNANVSEVAVAAMGAIVQMYERAREDADFRAATAERVAAEKEATREAERAQERLKAQEAAALENMKLAEARVREAERQVRRERQECRCWSVAKF